MSENVIVTIYLGIPLEGLYNARWPSNDFLFKK